MKARKQVYVSEDAHKIARIWAAEHDQTIQEVVDAAIMRMASGTKSPRQKAAEIARVQ